MFCLSCGAETPLGASACAVCGHDAATGSRAPAHALVPAPAPSHSAASLASPSPSHISLASPAASGLRFLAGDHTGPLPRVQPLALPAPASATTQGRDPDGSLLLVTAIALAADLLAPWSTVYGQDKAMLSYGAPAVALLALFGLAVLPLARPNLRARPLVAVAPLVVGAFCLGAGIFYWAMLLRENAFYAAPFIVSPRVSSQGWNNSSSPQVQGHTIFTATSIVAPAIGLYIFLLGAAILIVVGYRLFLRAARASARTAAPTQPASQPALPINPINTRVSPSLDTPSLAAHSAQPLPASIPAQTDAPDGHRLALPGSAAWNEAPLSPIPARPARGGASWGGRPMPRTGPRQ